MSKPMKMAVNLILCHMFFRVEYKNLEQLEKTQRCIICPNHTSIIDPFWIYAKTDNLYIMAKSELFKNRLVAKIFKHYHVFPIHRNRTDLKSTLTAKNIFEKNKGNVQFLIFPEGKVIKKENEIGTVRNGAVFVSAMEQVPIIPVYISRNVKMFGKIIVTFGEPIKIDKSILKSRENVQNESKKLINTIYKINEKYN